MAIRSIPMQPLDALICEECGANLTEKLSCFECVKCDTKVLKPIPYCCSVLSTTLEAYALLKEVFAEVLVLNVEAFISENGYEPVIASIFVVSVGGSYCYKIDKSKCSVLNGTLCKLGNLQVTELQRAYLTKQKPALPTGARCGLGYECPKCNSLSYPKKEKHTLMCQSCKCMFYI